MGSIVGGLLLFLFLVLELLLFLDQELFKDIRVFLSDIAETFQLLSGSFGSTEGLVRGGHEFLDGFDLTLAGLRVGLATLSWASLYLLTSIWCQWTCLRKTC